MNTLTNPGSGLAPFLEIKSAYVPAAAITADIENPVHKCTIAGIVQGVTFASAASKTGDNTNYRTYTLYNRKADGSGTVAVATLALTTGVNLTANIEKTIVLSSTAADLVVAAGDILTWSSVHTASGLTDAGGLLLVSIGRN